MRKIKMDQKLENKSKNSLDKMLYKHDELMKTDPIKYDRITGLLGFVGGLSLLYISYKIFNSEMLYDINIPLTAEDARKYGMPPMKEQLKDLVTFCSLGTAGVVSGSLGAILSLVGPLKFLFPEAY